MRSKKLLIGALAAAATTAALVITPSAFAVVGGRTSTETYPFLVDLTLPAVGDDIPALHRCGASMVTAEWAVTAGHCVVGAPTGDLIARVDSNDRTSGGEVRSIQDVVVHPGYDRPAEGVIVNDIALIRLSAPVPAAPIALATELPPPGTRTRIMGWGYTCTDDRPECKEKPVLLHELDTVVADPAQCSDMDAGKELCTGEPGAGTGACQGDSGGPQVMTDGSGGWLLAGVTSRDGRRETTCARHPSIYTAVAPYRSWIAEHVGG